MTRPGRKVRPRFSPCFHQCNRFLLSHKLSATNEYMSPQGYVSQVCWTNARHRSKARAQDDKTPGCHPERELWIYCGLLGNQQNNKLVVYEKMVVMLF